MLIPTKRNVKSITDMREDALGLLDIINKEGLAYIFYRSQPKAVMLNIDEFISMREIIEDYIDGKKAEQLAKEPRGKGVSLKKIAQKYV